MMMVNRIIKINKKEIIMNNRINIVKKILGKNIMINRIIEIMIGIKIKII